MTGDEEGMMGGKEGVVNQYQSSHSIHEMTSELCYS